MDPKEQATAAEYIRNNWPEIIYSIKDLTNMRVSFANLLSQTRYSDKTRTAEWKKTRETMVSCFESTALDHEIGPDDPATAKD